VEPVRVDIERHGVRVGRRDGVEPERYLAAVRECGLGADVPEGLAECSQCGRVGLPERVREYNC
jgi:hypothetical protein